jgi:hypothetical protein
MYYPSRIVSPANSLIFITSFLNQTWVPYERERERERRGEIEQE